MVDIDPNPASRKEHPGMNPQQVLALMLALSAALNVAIITALIARKANVGAPNAILTGAGAAATSLGLYFAAVLAYR
jgi:hypothetical protein